MHSWNFHECEGRQSQLARGRRPRVTDKPLAALAQRELPELLAREPPAEQPRRVAVVSVSAPEAIHQLRPTWCVGINRRASVEDPVVHQPHVTTLQIHALWRERVLRLIDLTSERSLDQELLL